MTPQGEVVASPCGVKIGKQIICDLKKKRRISGCTECFCKPANLWVKKQTTNHLIGRGCAPLPEPKVPQKEIFMKQSIKLDGLLTGPLNWRPGQHHCYAAIIFTAKKRVFGRVRARNQATHRWECVLKAFSNLLSFYFNPSALSFCWQFAWLQINESMFPAHWSSSGISQTSRG